jgi:hypothetical protein
METIDWTLGTATAFVTFGGFAIQQALTILDPFLTAALVAFKSDSDDVKKATMGVASLIIAIFAVKLGDFDAFAFLYKNHEASSFAGKAFTAVVLSAGTEGANSIQKYLGAVKDAKAAGPAPEVTVFPPTAVAARGGVLNFLAVVKNATDKTVGWSVVEAGAGAITPDGVFTAAPAFSGTCHVVAKSVEDTTVFAAASVKVG